MNNNLQKTNIKFNSDGNQIINENVDGGGKTQTIKYGLIRLISDKKEHRVSYKTLLDINKAKESEFDGQINIPEINMSVQVSQIVMMRSETENIRIEDNITNLPTAYINLDDDFNIINKPRSYFTKNKIDYYDAIVHYTERDGERQYYLEMDKIKRLLRIEFDKDGYDRITEIYHYGVKQ